jgi:hypothetical protein
VKPFKKIYKKKQLNAHWERKKSYFYSNNIKKEISKMLLKVFQASLNREN